MKIGILTFNWAINYGAILQMYALYHYLFSLDNNVVVINYVPDHFREIYETRIFKKPLKFKQIVKNSLELLIKKEQKRKFKEFINNNIVLSELIGDRESLIKLVQKFDLIIVGSDQVWNYDITKGYLKDYLLSDIACNKISYAASIGKKEITRGTERLFQDALKDFDFVSVREESTIEILNKICKRDDYKLVVDPIFLLNRNEWESLAKMSTYKLPNRDYVLVYMLEYDANLISSAKYLSRTYNMPVLSIEIPFFRFKTGMRGIKALHDVGPADFIKLFLSAEYILTNSFHGASFSLIFKKNFIPFVHPTLNERIHNVLSLYGLENIQIKDFHEFSESFKDIAERVKTTYTNQNKKIDSFVKASKEYLNEAIREVAKRGIKNHEK